MGICAEDAVDSIGEFRISGDESQANATGGQRFDHPRQSAVFSTPNLETKLDRCAGTQVDPRSEGNETAGFTHVANLATKEPARSIGDAFGESGATNSGSASTIWA